MPPANLPTPRSGSQPATFDLNPFTPDPSWAVQSAVCQESCSLSARPERQQETLLGLRPATGFRCQARRMLGHLLPAWGFLPTPEFAQSGPDAPRQPRGLCSRTCLAENYRPPAHNQKMTRLEGSGTLPALAPGLICRTSARFIPRRGTLPPLYPRGV